MNKFLLFTIVLLFGLFSCSKSNDNDQDEPLKLNNLSATINGAEFIADTTFAFLSITDSTQILNIYGAENFLTTNQKLLSVTLGTSLVDPVTTKLYDNNFGCDESALFCIRISYVEASVAFNEGIEPNSTQLLQVSEIEFETDGKYKATFEADLIREDGETLTIENGELDVILGTL